jgi:hypothetical protein
VQPGSQAEQARNCQRGAADTQFALVNVDHVLSGKRGFATAVASTTILFVSWSAVAVVYAWLRSKSETAREQDGSGHHALPPGLSELPPL